MVKVRWPHERRKDEEEEEACVRERERERSVLLNSIAVRFHFTVVDIIADFMDNPRNVR